MRFVIDMNLSPAWKSVFGEQQWESYHWSELGDPRATDAEIMEWARTHHSIVFTHDLDFGTLLATTQATGPSVIQIRTQDVSPNYLRAVIVDAILRFQQELETGALIIVDEYRNRIRLLPLNR
jgi:predicted nuclease of predicted toxin-antitoxin system